MVDEPLFADKEVSSDKQVFELPQDNPWKILVVDDEPDIHAATKLCLSRIVYQGRGVELLHAYDSEQAKSIVLDRFDIALAIVDVVMETDSAGLDFIQWLRDDCGRKDMRIILRTGQPGQAPEQKVILEYEINDYKEKSELTATRLYSSVITGLRGYKDVNLIRSLLTGLTKNQKATINAMALLCESRDTHLGTHLRRVSIMSGAIARQLKNQKKELVDDEFIELIELAAALHDTGKISIPDSILNAPRKLNKEEFDVIRTHPMLGFNALNRAVTFVEQTDLLKIAMNIAYYHHERWDGSGYPLKLRGSEIPLEARIVAIADVYDAIRAQRPYKGPIKQKEAIRIVTRERGKHFDPEVLDAFLAVVYDIEKDFVYEKF